MAKKPQLDLRTLRRLRLWPVQHTPAYYRRAAACAPAYFVRAILRLIADRSSGEMNPQRPRWN
jgi:hypothetical protein